MMMEIKLKIKIYEDCSTIHNYMKGHRRKLPSMWMTICVAWKCIMNKILFLSQAHTGKTTAI